MKAMKKFKVTLPVPNVHIMDYGPNKTYTTAATVAPPYMVYEGPFRYAISAGHLFIENDETRATVIVYAAGQWRSIEEIKT